MSKQFETFSDFEMMFDHIKQAEPAFLHTAMPKRYNAPGNYPNFGKVFVPSAYQNAFLNTAGYGTNETVNSGYTVFAKLAQYQVPVYYVAVGLCDALSATAPPNELMLDDIKWPMPAMVFMLPTAFSHKFFGRQVNFISAARFTAGEDIPSPGEILTGKMQTVGVDSPCDQIIIYYEAVEPKNGLVSNYNSNSPVTRRVGDVFFDDIKYNGEIWSPEQMFDVQEDGAFANRVFMFVVKMLLVMTARQSYVETGVEQRPAKMKHGRLRDALWSPNYIGRAYKAKSEDGGAGGTHASPRLHWRRGHIRNQPHGTGRLLTKVIWLEPTIIGAKEAEEHAGKIVSS